MKENYERLIISFGHTQDYKIQTKSTLKLGVHHVDGAAVSFPLFSSLFEREIQTVDVNLDVTHVSPNELLQKGKYY